MLFWFVGTVVVIVWWVFRDPAFDYRLLVLGAIFPIVELAFGRAAVLHSVTFAVALLTVLMLGTQGRRSTRKALLGLPIGLLLHLVVTGAWRSARVFWWPFGGTGFGDAPHPVAARGWWNAPLELAGLALCWWVFRRARLADPARRALFRRTGQLALPVPP